MDEGNQTVRDGNGKSEQPSHESLPLATGEQVGNYRIVRPLGKGAIGIVYLAEDAHDRTRVALKILRPDWKTACGDDYADLFRHEAELNRPLDHPRIVKLLDSGDHGGLPFHVFEFIDGTTLAEFRNGRILDPLVASRLIAEVAEAVQHSHRRGIVHRDLKPSNIMIDPAGRAHVTDFGIALEHSELGTGARFVGTPLYMSPEQVRGSSHHLDGRSDVYSLGVMLYEMVTGVHPTLPPNASQDSLIDAILNVPAPPLRQRADVSSEFDRICSRALAKDPEVRFHTAGDFAKALRRFVLHRQLARLVPVGFGILALVLAGLVAVSFPGNSSDTPTSTAAPPVVASGNAPSRSPEVPDQGSTRRLNAAEIAALDAALASTLPKGVAKSSLDEIRASAALIIARLQSDQLADDSLWRHFAAREDNTLQTALIAMCASSGVDPQRLIERLDREKRPDVRSALILALGEYTPEQLPTAKRQALLADVLKWYCEPSASVHSACAWLLTKWGYARELRDARRQLQLSVPGEQREWFEALPDIPMIALRVEGGFVPANEPRPTADFAISTYEVAKYQWDQVTHQTTLPPKSAAARRPKNFTSWHQCAAFCNRLSELLGLPASEHCYERIAEDFYRPFPDAVQRRGYRMPTLAEWIYASRAETITPRYWGRDRDRLHQYANCQPHSHFIPILPGSLKPNAFGLFDVLGNVTEWIHEVEPRAREQTSISTPVPIRGGSAWTAREGVQVDAEYLLEADNPGERIGLRLVRTLPSASADDDSHSLVLRCKRRVVLRYYADDGTLLKPNAGIPLVTQETLPTDERYFAGNFTRSAAQQPEFLVHNSSTAPLQLNRISADGCLALSENFTGPQQLAAGESFTLPLHVVPRGIGDQRGRIIIEWSDQAGAQRQRTQQIQASISGPSLETLEAHRIQNSKLLLDFGAVSPGTRVRQLITLVNRGDQDLEFHGNESSGALRIIEQPSQPSLAPGQYAYFEIELDTPHAGQCSGVLHIKTNDPLNPVLSVEARALAQQLATDVVVGIFRNGQWLLDYDRDGAPNETIAFGRSGDQPLVGDFDGDGQVELAVLQRVDSQHFELRIRFDRDESEPEIQTRSFEAAAGQWVIMDYNRDGQDDVAWVAPTDQNSLLSWQWDTDADSRWDHAFSFGLPGDTAIAGDWNGDGHKEVGVVRSNGTTAALNTWLLAEAEELSNPRQLTYGFASDTPVTADWNGDGKFDMGVFRVMQGTGLFLLDLDSDPDAESLIRSGVEHDIPVVFMSAR